MMKEGRRQPDITPSVPHRVALACPMWSVVCRSSLRDSILGERGASFGNTFWAEQVGDDGGYMLWPDGI